MRAVTVSAYGQEPVVSEVPKPQPGPGQVLIKVHAAGMNPIDRLIPAGVWKELMPATFPLVLGSDLSGVVDAVGPGEAIFQPGDEVFGQLMVPPLGSTGTYAEYVAVAATAALALTPEQLDPVVAAALPTSGVTALEIVDTLSPLRGKIMLLIGAGGGVGSFLTQFAAQGGAEILASVRGSSAKRVRSYGAAETIDYTKTSVIDAVGRAHPDGIDLLVDLASDAPEFATLARLVRRGGSALTTRHVADVDALAATGIKGVNFREQVTADAMRRLADAVANRGIEPPPITRINLADVPAVLRRPTGQADGKTVVTP
jgi:NADPH:quinone reductase-like Zn-dependent oxidoreductase